MTYLPYIHGLNTNKFSELSIKFLLSTHYFLYILCLKNNNNSMIPYIFTLTLLYIKSLNQN